MLAEHLDVTLLVRPEVPFARVAAALDGLGYTRRPGVRTLLPPMDPGEDELAAWESPDGFVVTYTYEPPCRLRRLDVADLGPTARGALQAALPLLDPDEVPALLRAPDPETRLLGVRAAVATERTDLLAALDALVGEDDVTVSDAAAAAFAVLEQVIQARVATFVRLSLLGKQARGVILGLPGSADALAALRPTLADAEAACGAHAARALAHAHAMLDATAPLPPIGDALDVVAATGAILRAPNDLSRAFASGWREIAGRLRPDGVWVTWRQAPMRYDGLFTTGEGRWVWFPKLWRALR